MRARLLLRIALIVVGLAFVGFFGLLVGMSDCGPDCQAAGERAPVVVFVGFGAFLATLGFALGRGDTLRATALAMLVGGGVALLLAFWTVAGGGRGVMTWLAIAISAGTAAVGAFLLRPTRR